MMSINFSCIYVKGISKQEVSHIRVCSFIPLLSDDCGNHITPINKVYKRLVNGAEDNIVLFYELFMESNL